MLGLGFKRQELGVGRRARGRFPTRTRFPVKTKPEGIAGQALNDAATREAAPRAGTFEHFRRDDYPRR